MRDNKQIGLDVLKTLPNYVEPKPMFIGEGAKKLYKLEEARSTAIKNCAREWANVTSKHDKDFWTTSIPQALHDALLSFQPECGIIAAEAILKEFGWTVVRPQ